MDSSLKQHLHSTSEQQHLRNSQPRAAKGPHKCLGPHQTLSQRTGVLSLFLFLFFFKTDVARELLVRHDTQPG